jgi:hypothetical protein
VVLGFWVQTQEGLYAALEEGMISIIFWSFLSGTLFGVFLGGGKRWLKLKLGPKAYCGDVTCMHLLCEEWRAARSLDYSEAVNRKLTRSAGKEKAL